MLPLVSVVIPVYNSRDYLEACLNSIIEQSYKNLEIILIDDGSSDGSGNILDQYAAKDNRIKVVHNTNHGVSFTRNYGIKIATGSKILFVDSDDTVELDYVEKLVEPLKNHDYDLVICNINDVYVGKNKVKHRKLPKKLTGIFREDFYMLFKVPILSGPVGKLYSSAILRNNKIYFDNDVHYSEDFLFNLNYYKFVRNYILIRRPLYNYYHRLVASLSKNISSNNFNKAMKVLDCFKAFLIESNIRHSDVMMSNLALIYLRNFREVNDNFNDYIQFKKRVAAIRELLDGLYAIPYNPLKATKILLLRFDITYILFILFKLK